MLPFPNIDPVAVSIGPLAIRWYSLAYLAGIILGWWMVKKEHVRQPITNLSQKALDDMMVWAVVGIIAGGRLGYVLFYKPLFYLHYPLQVFHIWEGGMSFHGGMLGIIAAFFLFCRKYHVPFLEVMDVIVCAAPIGLFFGRVANFINGELYGRITDSPLGIVFPHGGALPRHPSQLYEAGMEGLLLFVVLFVLLNYTKARSAPGLLSGVFLIGYGLARLVGECFREPDAHLGFLLQGATMGQLLSLPMVALGIYLICTRKPLVS